MKVMAAGPNMLVTAGDSIKETEREPMEKVSLDESNTAAKDSGDFRDSSKEGFTHILDFLKKRSPRQPVSVSKGPHSKSAVAIKVYDEVSMDVSKDLIRGLILDKTG